MSETKRTESSVNTNNSSRRCPSQPNFSSDRPVESDEHVNHDDATEDMFSEDLTKKSSKKRSTLSTLSSTKRSWSSRSLTSDDSDISLNSSMSSAMAGLACSGSSAAIAMAVEGSTPGFTGTVCASRINGRKAHQNECEFDGDDELEPKHAKFYYGSPKQSEYPVDSPMTQLQENDGLFFVNSHYDCATSRDDSAIASHSNSVRHTTAAAHVWSGRSRRDIPQKASTKRKLILHFDIRNTILVADTVTQVNVEQALNTFLTGVTWGALASDDYADWRWYSEEPSLAPPVDHADDAMTYYKLLEKSLVRGPSDRALLRQATGDFTSQPIGAKFRPFFEKHLKLLEWKYGCEKSTDEGKNEDDAARVTSSPRVDKILTLIGGDGRPYHYILESFVRMIYDLHVAGRDFAIVIRTYGMDLENVLVATRRSIAGHHPAFARPLPIDVRCVPGQIRRFSDGRIQLNVDSQKTNAISGDALCNRCDNDERTEPSQKIVGPTKRASDIGCGCRADTTRSAVTQKVTGHSRHEQIAVSPFSNRTSLANDSSAVHTPYYDTDREIYEHLSTSTGVTGYVDDFRFWQDDEYRHRSGKPLWIELDDERVHHIFFDDNIRVKDIDSIVDVRLFDSCGVQKTDGSHPEGMSSEMKFRSLELDEIAAFEDVCLVQADLLEATGNVEYFSEKIKICEKNYEKMLRTKTDLHGSHRSNHGIDQ